MAAKQPASASAASQLITQHIRELGDWRSDALAWVRQRILDADPEIEEEVKWAKPTSPGGVPVWSRHGIICTGESYKTAVKLTFARGADVPDPNKLFNASLEGNARRAIDIHEGETLNEAAFKALIRAAVKVNGAAVAEREKKKA